MEAYSRRALWLLVAAMAYIVAQSVWWALLLLRRDEEIARLSVEVSRLSGAASDSVPTGHTLMVLGEAGVFLLLLAVVLGMALHAIRRDLRLAALQRNFLLAVTHELRTPVAAIKLQLQTLNRRDLPEGAAQSLREATILEAERLATLTDKVLLAASDGTREIPLSRMRLDLIQVLREAVMRAQLRDQGAHRFELDAPDRLPVCLDPDVMRSIVDNLLENAAKYAPSGTVIAVRAVQEARLWRVEVEDQGPGIPPAERGRVFERFYRSGNEETRQHPGTGLGLFIVHRLVRRMGGRIEIRDAQPHGAIFTASFPIAD